MPQGYFDDEAYMHPKIVAAGDAAVGLWFRSILFSRHNRTKGKVPKNFARGAVRGAVAALLRENLWEKDVDGDGYLIHGYEEWYWSEAERSERGKKAAAARHAKTNGEPPPGATSSATSRATSTACRSAPSSVHQPPTTGVPVGEIPESSSDVGPRPDDDEFSESGPHDRVLAEVWRLIADARLRDRLQPEVVAREGVVARPDSWLAETVRTSSRAHLAAARRLLDAKPELLPHEIAAELEPALFEHDPVAARERQLSGAHRYGVMVRDVYDELTAVEDIANRFGDDELRDAALKGYRGESAA